jgi:hypothetical protein
MIFTTIARIGSKSHWVKNHLASFIRLVVAFPLVLSAGSWESLGAESGPPPPPAASHLGETNSPELLQACWQLQEQLRAALLAIEQNRQETKEAAAQNAEALSKGLQGIQQAFSAQRAQDLEAMQRSNKVMLIVVGTFAAIGFLTLLMTTYFQWRMSKGLAKISAALPTALGLGPGSAAAALAPAKPSNVRLLGAIEHSEKRSHELEPSPHPVVKRHEGPNMAIENRPIPEPRDLLRKRQFRALGVAVIVGLICAAGLALLFYVVTYRKLGYG